MLKWTVVVAMLAGCAGKDSVADRIATELCVSCLTAKTSVVGNVRL
jgi:hypothetical protein